jgi:hypothetical protein
MGADSLDGNSPVANGGLDDDGDGVSNAIEHVLQALDETSEIDGSSDRDEDGIADADEIRFGTDPARDEQPVPWIELIQEEAGPVSALTTAGGGAVATAMIGGHQAGTLAYDWTGSDNAVLAVVTGGQVEKRLTFSPRTLPPGPYNLVLRVERVVGDYRSPVSAVEFTFNVLRDAADIADGDNDGIPDSSDDSDARQGFANELQAQGSARLRATPGVRLQLGSTARIRGARSALVTRSDIASAGDGRGGSVGDSEDDFDYLSGIYDFEITNLPEAGSMIRIVIPQAALIEEFPEYRKYLAGRGWGGLVENDRNAIESAPGNGGSCPEPGASSWQSGLTPGHGCVQLTLEDGGPNDGDAAQGPNGIIRDPGGIGTPQGEVSVGQGSGSFGPAALIVLALFTIAAAGRRLAGASCVSTGAIAALCLLAMPSMVRADAFVGAGGGVSFLDPDTGTSPFQVEDDQDTGLKVFAGFDLTPVSRNLSVEAFWADLGQAALTGNGAVDYSLYGAGLSYGIGSVRAPRFSAFVEAGVARLDASANVPLFQEDDTLLFFGLAGSFAVRRHWFLQLEYEYFAEDAQLVSLSIVRRFRTRSASDARTIPLPDD